MSKVGIIYWSSTGNTEAMAQAVEEGAKAAGADVEIMEVADADVDKALSYDAWNFDSSGYTFWCGWCFCRNLLQHSAYVCMGGALHHL